MVSFAWFILYNCWMVASGVFVFYQGDCVVATPILYYSNVAVFAVYCIFVLFEIGFTLLVIKALL